jgi:hypothetical protein
MSSLETVITVVVIIAYSIGRQVVGEPLRVKRLIGLPVALTILGIVDVATSNVPGPTHFDIVLIGAGCAINVAIGICQGRLMRLETRNGFLWGQMPKSVLWWWAAKIASGLLLDGIGHAFGAHLATISAVMLLGLGFNRLAQGTTVSYRALASGIPFAPEPGRLGPGLNARGRSGKTRFFANSPDPGQPRSSPTGDYSSGSKIRPPARFNGSSTHSTSSAISLPRQIWQMFLCEINDRLSDALKQPKENIGVR